MKDLTAIKGDERLNDNKRGWKIERQETGLNDWTTSLRWVVLCPKTKTQLRVDYTTAAMYLFATNSCGVRTRLPSFPFRAANYLPIIKVDTIVLIYRCLHLVDRLLGCDVDKPRRSSWIPIRCIIILLCCLRCLFPHRTGVVQWIAAQKAQIREPNSNDSWFCYIQLCVHIPVKSMNLNISPR